VTKTQAPATVAPKIWPLFKFISAQWLSGTLFLNRAYNSSLTLNSNKPWQKLAKWCWIDEKELQNC
jgi:hypothetical protein